MRAERGPASPCWREPALIGCGSALGVSPGRRPPWCQPAVTGGGYRLAVVGSRPVLCVCGTVHCRTAVARPASSLPRGPGGPVFQGVIVDFELSAEQRLLRDTLRAFVDEQIRPVAR